jgi:hypothetical protein
MRILSGWKNNFRRRRIIFRFPKNSLSIHREGLSENEEKDEKKSSYVRFEKDRFK